MYNYFLFYSTTLQNVTQEYKRIHLYIGVKPIIHQSELRTYTKLVPFKENSSFRCVAL